MAVEVGGITARLGFVVDRREAELYEQKLDELRRRVAKRDQFRAQLGADYDARAFNAYERDLRRNEKATDDNVKAQGRLRTAFGSVSSAGVAAFAAGGGLYALWQGFKSITSASIEAEKAQARLKTQVTASGLDWDKHAAKIDKVIQRHSQLAGIDDEELGDAFTNILRASGDVAMSLEGVGLAADIASARSMDVSKAGELVGKVMAGNTGILSRYGIVLEEGATKQEAIGALQDKFSGQARAYGRTQQGAMDRVQVSFENLRETIGERLGPAIADGANNLARFIDQFTRGKGEGGEFRDMLVDTYNAIKGFVEGTVGAVRGIDNFLQSVETTVDRIDTAVNDALLGAVTTVLGVIEKVADIGGKLPGVGGKFKSLEEDVRAARMEIDGHREAMRRTERAALEFDMDKVRDENRKTGRAFKEMARDGEVSLRDIAKATDKRTKEIRRDLDRNSEEGREALAENFRRAADAVRRQMDRSGKVTKEGMREIRSYLVQELQVYGLSLRSARNIARGDSRGGQFGDPRGPGTFEGGRQRGGWLGARGMIGSDTIQVAPGYWAAPGEYYAKGPGGHGAVINRHQAPIVDMALMRGGHTLDTLPRDESALPRIEAALADLGGLNALFASVRRPHMLQGGGIVELLHPGNDPAHGDHLHVAMRSVRAIINLGKRLLGLGWQVSEHPAFGGVNFRHAANSYHDRSLAIDVNWPDPGQERARIAALLPMLGSGELAPAKPIPRHRILGGGAVGRAVQGALDLARAGGQSVLDRAGQMSFGTASAGSVGKGYLANLWRRANPGLGNPALMAAIAMAESSGNPSAHGPPDGRGLWQIEWPIWGGTLGHLGNPYNPLANARMAGEVLRQQGLGAWVVYNTGAYRQYLQGGGHTQSGMGRAPGRGRARRRGRRQANPLNAAVDRFNRRRRIPNAIGMADFYENKLALAELTPTKTDDLQWLRALERTYGFIVDNAALGTAAEYAPQLLSVRGQIAELTAPAEPTTPSAPAEVIRPPSPEEIAQGVRAQLASFQLARRSLFTQYGSNFTLAGRALVPGSATAQAAGLMHFGALGGTTPSQPTRVIHQTNVFPTPPPEPHLFARLTLHDLQAAP